MGLTQSCTLCVNREVNPFENETPQSRPLSLRSEFSLDSNTELLQLLRRTECKSLQIGGNSYNLKFIKELWEDENSQKKQLEDESKVNKLKSKRTVRFADIDNSENNGHHDKNHTKSEVPNTESSIVQPPRLRLASAYSHYDGSTKNLNDLEYDKSIVEIKKYNRASNSGFGSFHSGSRSTRHANDRSLENPLHFSFLYASPLIFNLGTETKDDFLGEISFKDEYKGIIESLTEREQFIRYRYQLATVQNLIDSFRQRTLGLHFSGHGLVNEKDKFDKFPSFVKQIEGKGDILVFEDQVPGLAQFLFEKELTQILSQCPSKLAFVVIASCHSEKVGQIFKKAGAEHVICIEREKQLNDQAAVQFSKIFYSHVFASQSSICQAYEQAKNLVQLNIGKKESDKFKLILQDHHICNKDMLLDYQMQPGNVRNILPQSELISIPTNIKNQIPRNKDTYDIISMLISDKISIVEVFGVPGIGKTSVIIKAVHYLADRHIYKGGIIYSNLSGIHKLNDALLTFLKKVDQESAEHKKNSHISMFEAQNSLIKILSQKRNMLLVFDNVEDLLTQNKSQFINFLNILILERENVQVIVGTNIYFDGLQNFATKNIRALDQKKSRDLFISKVATEDLKELYKIEQITKLHQVTPSLAMKIKPCSYSCQKHEKSLEGCIRFYLENHPLFKTFMKQPLTLCLAASLFHNHSLAEIYQKLISEQSMQQDNKQISSFLVMTIEQSIQMLDQFQENTVDILYLIGQTVTGLKIADIDLIYNISTQQIIDKLLETSFIINENDDGQYKVQNFIAKFIEEHLDKAKKKKLNRLLASHYIQMIINKKKEVTSQFIDYEELFKSMKEYESNIVSCIQNLIQLQEKNQEKVARKSLGAEVIRNKLLNEQFQHVRQRRQTVDTQFRNTRSFGKNQVKRESTRNDRTKKTLNQKDFEKIEEDLNEGDEEDSKSYTPSHQNQVNQPFKDEEEEQDFEDNENNNIFSEEDILHSDMDEDGLFIEWQKIRIKKIKTQLTLRHQQTMSILKHNMQKEETPEKIEDIQEDEEESSEFSAGTRAIGDIIENSEKEAYHEAIRRISVRQQINPTLSQDSSSHGSSNIDFLLQQRERANSRRNSVFDSYKKINSLNSSSIFKMLTQRNLEEIKEEEDKATDDARNSEFQNMIDGEYLPDSEWQILLYHYLSLQAMKSTDKDEFQQLIDKFNLDQDDDLLVANIQLLQVYLFIRFGNYESAATELLNIQKLFEKVKCVQGEAIVYYFLAYLFKKLRRNNARQHAMKYLAQAQQLFQDVEDDEGIQYCSELELLSKQLIQSGNELRETMKIDRALFAGTKNNRSMKRFVLVQDEECLNMLLNQVGLQEKHF